MRKTICDICGKDITTDLIPQLVFQEINPGDGRPTSHVVKLDVCISCQNKIEEYIKKIKKTG